MLHFIDESRRLGDEVKNFVRVALSVCVELELIHCVNRQEFADRMNWEVNSHDLVVLDHLDVAGVHLEELEDRLLRELVDLFLDVWQHDGKLVDHAEDVEALIDAAFERVLHQRLINLD